MPRDFDPTDEMGVEETVEAYRIEMEEELSHNSDEPTMEDVRQEIERVDLDAVARVLMGG